MRRKVGVGGLKGEVRTREAANRVGTELAEEELQALEASAAAFREKLEAFGRRHRADINRSPILRGQFTDMCTSVGVDPLASSGKKGFWGLLGLGDFYHALAVQIVDACLRSRAVDGGLVPMAELQVRLQRMRGPKLPALDRSDIERALACLQTLGAGYSIVQLAGRAYVRSVPHDLTPDAGEALRTLADMGGVLNCEALSQSLQWDLPRSELALHALLRLGVCWVDSPDPALNIPSLYYLASMFL